MKINRKLILCAVALDLFNDSAGNPIDDELA